MPIPADYGRHLLTMTGTHIFPNPSGLVVASGTTANRPTLATNRMLQPGFLYFDTTLNKLIIYNGSDWYDGNGTFLGATTSVTANRQVLGAPSALSLGVTYTQHTLEPFGNAPSITAGSALLTAFPGWRRQHTMAFGVSTNTQPSAGAPYNFIGTPGSGSDVGLDQRVSRMKANGGTSANMALVVLGTPDWMRNVGGTSISNTPPTVDHYSDYYALLTVTAQRYSTPSGFQNDNQPVLYYEIWNEINTKGFGGNIAGYCTFYTGCANALRAVNPNIKIGGPYVTFRQSSSSSTTTNQSMLATFLSTVASSLIDYVVFDFELDGPVAGTVYTAATYLSNVPFLDTMVAYVQSLTTKPIRISEYYWNFDLAGVNMTWAFQAAWYLAFAIRAAALGVNAIAHWQPEAEQNQGTDSTGAIYPAGVFPWNDAALFSTTRVASGGVAFPSYTAMMRFAALFPQGTLLFPVATSEPGIVALANGTTTFVVNVTPSPITTIIDGVSTTIPAYSWT